MSARPNPRHRAAIACNEDEYRGFLEMRTLITAARRRTIRTALLAGAALAVTSAAIAQYGRDDDQYNFGDEDTPCG